MLKKFVGTILVLCLVLSMSAVIYASAQVDSDYQYLCFGEGITITGYRVIDVDEEGKTLVLLYLSKYDDVQGRNAAGNAIISIWRRVSPVGTQYMLFNVRNASMWPLVTSGTVTMTWQGTSVGTRPFSYILIPFGTSRTETFMPDGGRMEGGLIRITVDGIPYTLFF